MTVLQLAGTVEPDSKVAEYLATLSVSYPSESLTCLSLLIDGDLDGWKLYALRENARTILRNALQCNNEQVRRDAEDLVHRLAAMGHLEFRDLVS